MATPALSFDPSTAKPVETTGGANPAFEFDPSTARLMDGVTGGGGFDPRTASPVNDDSPGFLSSVAEGLMNLGRADTNTMTAIGRQAAQVGKGASPVRDLLAQSEVKHGIRPGLLDSIAHAESGYDPTQTNKDSGAQGLMQFMPKTAAILTTRQTRRIWAVSMCAIC
jgi:hypothetical protein